MDTIWFHEALDRAGKSQADLARYLGLPPSAISRMLSGARQMKLLEAVQTAAFLGVTQDEVLRHAGDGSACASFGLAAAARPAAAPVLTASAGAPTRCDADPQRRPWRR